MRTYSQEMDQWSAQNGRKRTGIGRLFFPDSDAPFANRAIGFLWRIGLFILLPFLLLKSCVEGKFEGSGFSDSAAEELRSVMGAEEVSMGNLVYSNGRGQIADIEIVGAEGQSFSTIEAASISFNLPSLSRFKDPWPVRQIRVSNLKIVLPGTVRPEFEDDLPTLITAGLSFKPGIPQMERPTISVDRFEVLWGAGDYNKGSVTLSQMRLVPVDGGWDIELKGAKVNRGWLTSMEVEELDGTLRGTQLTLQEAPFTIGVAGVGTVSAAVNLVGEAPLKAQLAFNKVDVESVMKKPLDVYFTGNFEGQAEITLPLFGGGEMLTDATLVPDRLRLRGIPILQELSKITLNRTLYDLPFDEGEIHIRAHGYTLDALSYDLTCRNLAILRGNLSGIFGGEYTGGTQLGLADYIFRRFPEFQAQYFPQVGEERNWISLPHIGKIQDWNREITSQFEAVAESTKGQVTR